VLRGRGACRKRPSTSSARIEGRRPLEAVGANERLDETSRLLRVLGATLEDVGELVEMRSE
jgi:hypothetical protein